MFEFNRKLSKYEHELSCPVRCTTVDSLISTHVYASSFHVTLHVVLSDFKHFFKNLIAISERYHIPFVVR